MKRYRTWPVFTIGLGSLLLLIFLPGIAALRQSSEIYEEIRNIQHSHERTQSVLFSIERQVLQMSVAVRDFLLDNSPVTTNVYRRQFDSLQRSIEDELRLLAMSAPPQQTGTFDRLRQQLRTYAATAAPIFDWTPAERLEKGTFFLREQQRPRRESILAIADEIGHLYDENYRTRYEETNASQRRFRDQLKIAIAVAFILGAAVAGSTVVRLSALERQSERQRLHTQRAENEMRSLSARLMQAQEEERRAISRELHDEVGQVLTALRLELGTLGRLRHESGPEYDEHLAECKTLAEQTLRTVRDLAVGLRPSVLDLGLVPALQWQARHFSRTTETEATVRVHGELPQLPDSYLTCVYRIVQEALTNAARHASARQAEIEVGATEDGLNVSISDDGIGLRKNWTPTRGLGLIGIEERARELGGKVTIESDDGAGVRIRVRLPLPAGAES